MLLQKICVPCFCRCCNTTVSAWISGCCTVVSALEFYLVVLISIYVIMLLCATEL
ncbi:hypothetical protein HMPREF1548_06418 [Clostridium sp. KLE 1755]|nr:hypothetical protein HMPREF1548_06418 [Clostridium sp. KLE 1755]